jgi:hypothetical protein
MTLVGSYYTTITHKGYHAVLTDSSMDCPKIIHNYLQNDFTKLSVDTATCGS